MRKATYKRNTNRLLKIFQARVAKDALKLSVKVIPLAAIPEVVLKRAVLSRPRRPKGVAKAKHIWPVAN